MDSLAKWMKTGEAVGPPPDPKQKWRPKKGQVQKPTFGPRLLCHRCGHYGRVRVQKMKKQRRADCARCHRYVKFLSRKEVR